MSTSRDVVKGAEGYIALWDETPVAIAIIRHSASHRVGVKSVARIVVQPDYQGLGIAIAVIDALGEYYDNRGQRMTIRTSLPGFAKGLSKRWVLAEKPRRLRPHSEPTTRASYRPTRTGGFEYPGKSLRKATNERRLKKSQ